MGIDGRGGFKGILRLLPGLAGIMLIFKALGYTDLSIIADPRVVAPVIIVLALALLAILFYRRGVSLGKSHDATVGVSENVSWEAFELEFMGSEEERLNASRTLARIINDRAGEGYVKYSVLSIVEGGARRSIVILSSLDSGKMDVEREVFKTIVSSTVKGVKLRSVRENAIETLIEAIEGLAPSNKGSLYPSISVKAFYVTGNMGGALSKGVYLGKALDSAVEKPIYLSLEDITGHIGVFGSTGSGKSTTLATLSLRVSRTFKIPVIIMDWTGEYMEIMSRWGVDFRVYNPIEGEASINPLYLLKVDDGLDITVDVLSKALELTEPQAYMLTKILDSSNIANLHELEYTLESLLDDSRWDREVRKGLLRKIGVLTKGSARRAFESHSIPSFSGISVLNLSSVKNSLARAAYVMTFLAYVFVRRVNGVDPDRTGTLFVIDEAHNVFKRSGGLGFIDQLVAESRKYGVYLALATQSPSITSNSVLLNTNTKIIHALKSARDKNVISDTLSLSPQIYSRLDKLSRGEALLHAPSIPEPILVSIDLSEPFTYYLS